MDQSNEENYNRGKLTSLPRDGVYHSQGGFEDYPLDEKIQYIDFGEDEGEEMYSSLGRSIAEAESAGM